MQFSLQSTLPRGESKLGERAGSVLHFHARIMFGSCSEHGRIMLESSAIVHDASTVFGKSLRFWSAILRGRRSFGDVGGRVLLLRAL